jgi:hypothetical protein
MLSVLKSDPSFVNFQPHTAEEAVDRFVRCRRNGLKGYLVPECLIACAQALPAGELGKFEAWIINPNQDLSGVQMCEQKEICESNNRIFQANLRRVEEAMELDGERSSPQPVDDVPPLPAEYGTMFDVAAAADRSSDDEKMEIDTLSLEPQRGTPPPSDR